MTPEGLVKKDVKAMLDAHNAFYTMPVPSGYGESMLDFVGHHRGEYFEIETKADGKEPTPRQQHRIERLRESGAKVFVIIGRSVERDPDTWYPLLELEQWLKR